MQWTNETIIEWIFWIITHSDADNQNDDEAYRDHPVIRHAHHMWIFKKGSSGHQCMQYKVGGVCRSIALAKLAFKL